MNMKKSIAGVMAGAMAVSAMAASVSAVDAQESIELYYDLKEQKWDTTKGKATVLQYYTTADLATAYQLNAADVAGLDDKGYTTLSFGIATVADDWKFDKTGAKTIELSLNANAAPGATTSSPASATWSYTSAAPLNLSGVFGDVTSDSTLTFNVPLSLGGYQNSINMTPFGLGSLGYGEVTENKTEGDAAVAAKAEGSAANVEVTVDNQTLFEKKATADAVLVATGGSAAIPASYKVTKADGSTLLIEVMDEDALQAAATGTYVYDGTNWTDTTGDAVVAAIFNLANPVNGDKIEITAAVPAVAATWDVDPATYGLKVEGAVKGDSVIITASKAATDGTTDTTVTPAAGYGFNAITAKMTFTTNGWSNIKKEDITKSMTPATEFVDAEGKAVMPTTFEVTDLSAGAWSCIWTKAPASNLNAPMDVIAALKTPKDNGNKYNAPVAVLNDAIANGTNVIFTFNSYVGDLWKNKAGERGFTTEQDVSDSDGGKFATQKAFEQHLYGDATYADKYGFSGSGQDVVDNFGSYSNAWGYNLFNGAIVVNSGVTMQLNQADKFTWDSNTLTFDWDTITADGKVTNANTLLTSMLLYTPVEWFWDSLTVTVEKGEEDDAAADSPITEDDDVIDDESEDLDDEDITDEEKVTEAETEATTAAVAAVPSTPNTGNASVALAVIPVALAAAAVVAKKRG